MFPTKLKLWDKRFPSSEHAFQYSKASFMHKYHLGKKILSAKSAYEAKRISKFIKTDQRWEENKCDFMFEVIQAKYNQCKRFREYLNSTRGKKLIENTKDYYGEEDMMEKD